MGVGLRACDIILLQRRQLSDHRSVLSGRVVTIASHQLISVVFL